MVYLESLGGKGRPAFDVAIAGGRYVNKNFSARKKFHMDFCIENTGK